MTLRTEEDTLIWRRKLWIAICGGIVLEDALNLSSDRLLDDDDVSRTEQTRGSVIRACTSSEVTLLSECWTYSCFQATGFHQTYRSIIALYSEHCFLWIFFSLRFFDNILKHFSSSTGVLYSPPFASPLIWSCYENNVSRKRGIETSETFSETYPILWFLYPEVLPTWKCRIFFYLGSMITYCTRFTGAI